MKCCSYDDMAALLFFLEVLLVVVSGGSFDGNNNLDNIIRVSSCGSTGKTFLCNPQRYPHINYPSTYVQDIIDIATSYQPMTKIN